jgi:hypothetical protein
MKQMLTEITTGNSGNGNSDIPKELITRSASFISNDENCIYHTFAGSIDPPVYTLYFLIFLALFF